MPAIPEITDVDAKGRLGVPDEGLFPDRIDPFALSRAGRDDVARDEDAFEPPSEAVRFEMRKMELEAEIENAGGAVMGAADGLARPVGPPSREALEAAQAGLLDPVGPAGETNLSDRILAWEEAEGMTPPSKPPSTPPAGE